MPMMPIFYKHKQPREHVVVIYDGLLVLQNINKNDKEKRKAVEEIARALSSLREALTDRSDSRVGGKDKDTEFSNAERARVSEIISEITQEIINRDMVPLILAHLDAIEFESCKQMVELFGNILRKPARPFNPMVRYLCEHPEILATLLSGYDTPETAIHFGAILRDACRNESITRLVLGSSGFYKLFEYAQCTAFDISSDAFATLRDLLTRHKPEVATFIINNYNVFFQHYLTMLTSENYVTKRQALKLLGELLMDRHNSEIMNRYVADPENLKLMMNLLKSKEKQVAFETFHCFKVFVASPTKSRPVHMILFRNRNMLIPFLETFQTDRSEDTQFKDEKLYLINQISDLQSLAPT